MSAYLKKRTKLSPQSSINASLLFISPVCKLFYTVVTAYQIKLAYSNK